MEFGDDIKKKVEKINKIKISSIFKKLFDKTQGNNQDERFESALKNLPNEFMELKRKNKNFDDKTKKEFQIIVDVLGLKEDEKTQKELKYMEDSSGAEEDIKSMIYFYLNFKLNDNNTEEDVEELGILLQTAYENIQDTDKKKENLNLLKEKGIYDCEKKGIHVQFFNLFYNQKEAIDFLLTKSHENLEIIKDKFISIDNSIKATDIDEVDNCIDFINNMLRGCKKKIDLFEKIKNISENLLSNFKKFIKIFPYLVELDNNSDNSYNLYVKAKKYFNDATYYISLNCEEFKYKDPENKIEKTIDLNEIKSIKHKINIPKEVEIKLRENQELPEGQERISLEKASLLLTFKEVVSNIELIEQFIWVFQIKGCSLPIEIKINLKYPEAKYFLKKRNIKFEDLSKYLLNVKNYLEKILDSNYKRQQNLRFLYGKQFDTLGKHISGNCEIPSFLRYILNNLNDNISIKEGIKSFPRSTQNYVDEYKEYSDDSFKIYNNYISSVMKENGNSIEELYEKMKIKTDANDKLVYKGIYLYKSSDYNSMEEDILKIFIEKTKNIPIAQNILISNKETSYEEIQAFFHRAFLCRFNTLFAIEINDSLSDYQLKIMNNFISQLLKFQLDKYNKNSSVKIDIKETNKYIEPLIIFVYNANKLNESFLNEINKFNPGEYPKIKNISLSDDRVSISSKKMLAQKVEHKLNKVLLDNTHIYSSEICGLGKTEKIKYIIIDQKKKEYIYFPLGGKLSRNIIFKKVEKILERVNDVTKAAIHLDLYETEDTSILNEFLFSFCFTKFYANDRNVLYIPINLEIYIEIPNCFNNFLDNYPILKYFKIDRIKFKNREKLRLNKEKAKFFKWMIPEKIDGKKQTPEEYINTYIGAEKFSYHQINIFINLYMNQYKIDNRKLQFLDWSYNDVTEKCIEDFAKCTQYFTLGVYAKLLTENLEEENDSSLNKSSNKNIEETSNNSKDSEGIFDTNINLDITLDTNNKNIIINNKNEINIKKTENNEKIITDYEELRTNYIDKLSKLYENDLKNEKYEIPLIFTIKNTNYYKEIFLSDQKLKKYESKEDSKTGNNKTNINFLKEIQCILQLENPLTKTNDSKIKSLQEIIEQDNYVITTDNFRKMILILYRILADIPVILMGETGCGKTGLIRKLYQLLNNGEDMDPNKNMVNVDSSINDEKLIEKMEDINKEARAKQGKDFWVLFDEINTCNSLGLLNEIFINRSYSGTKLEKNIRLIGTCNPYRLKSDKEESCGLTHPYKNKGLAYDVNILPQSLMYFIFNFGSLEKKDEDKYIKSILSNHFKDFDIELINIVKEIISKCQEKLRGIYGPSIVSLREIKRFLKLYDNLVEYYKNKDEIENEKNMPEKQNEDKKDEENKSYIKIIKVFKWKKSQVKNNKQNKISNLNKIKAIIVTTYLSYYIRLIDPEKRTNFESFIKPSLIELSNYFYFKKEKKEESKESKKSKKSQNEGINDNEKQNEIKNDFSNPLGIKWEPLIKDYMKCKSDNNQNFSIFFENECDYIIENINLDKGIAKNRILKENIFLQFIAITANIPLIIIGKPGSSKSLSFQQLKKSMRGKYSKSNFFRKYPQILTTYFQGSESTLSEDIDNLFEIGKNKLRKYQTNKENNKENDKENNKENDKENNKENDKENNKENRPISLIIFDEIGLSEFAKDNPLKVLHKNLEYDGVKDGLSFVGFSNWKLDSSKLNRVLYLSVPDLDRLIDDLKDTAKCIAESLRDNNIDQVLLELLCKSYKSYQEMVKKIKDYVVYKELELQEMKLVLDSLTQDEIKKKFGKEKKSITLDDFKKIRQNLEIKKKYSWKYGNFEDVKNMDEFKALYSKNRSINQEFHGNRDFYNYVKGVCNIKSISKNLDNNDSDISKQIEKVIERNFGGVDINLDLDFELSYSDETDNMDKFKKMLNKFPKAKEKLKLPSVFLFKYIYNEEIERLYKEGSNSDGESDETDNFKLEKYKIKEQNLTNYNLIECINGNINDNDARYLLLEIEEGLKYLVYQIIITKNPGKEIIYMEGSPFINDIKDKSGEYKIKKISEIQNYCNKEIVLILSNLNQIYAFLYDFFNRNFIIKDDKKYGRICQGNFTEQLTYVHDKFRIIIMIDKDYAHKQESPFLNRFEKAIVKFEGLLSDKEKRLSGSIFKELGIKEQIRKNINYNIKNLLINYNESNIDRLCFFYSNQYQDLKEDVIKKKIIEKIARTLPQDVIINLEDKHIIKSYYKDKKIANYKDYIENIKLTNNKENKENKLKISIIYTFTSIISNIDAIKDSNSQQIISEIKRENQLIGLINEKKFNNKRTDNNFFIMHFYQHELDKINFIISTLNNNFDDEQIKFIFIVHIKRIMDKKVKEKIYSIPDIDEKVDQIFIDNLNGPNIFFEDFAEKGIKQVLDNTVKVNEFPKALKTYYNSYIEKYNFIEKYLPKIIEYFCENKELTNTILSKATELIDNEIKNNVKDKNNENIEIFNKIKKEIFDNSYINHNTIDIISLIINVAIIEKRLRGAIMRVIDVLESDNILTTLLTLDKSDKIKKKYELFCNKENLFKMIQRYLDLVKIPEIQKKATFKKNYCIPGFLSFYDLISKFISKNVTEKFFKNEKKLRDSLKKTPTLKRNFDLEQEKLLDILSQEIITDESNNYKFINEVYNKCPSKLLLKDYINYFLDKNNKNNEIIDMEYEEKELSDIESNKSISEYDEEQEKIEEIDDFYMKIIEQIIALRYKENTDIIEKNKDNEFNKFLIKIIWLEANKNYIFTIIQLFKEAKNKIYKNKAKDLLKQVKNLIRNNKLKYITDEERNPEHTTEVNECYYIILGALYLAITDFDKIILYDPDNNKDYVEAKEGQIRIKIGNYFKCLKNIVKVSQPFNDMLYLFSNELYIIVELNSIINLLNKQKNEYIDIPLVEKLVKNLRENIDIIRVNKGKENELIKNIEDLINLISENIQNKDKEYYTFLRSILLQEIMKVKNKNFRLNIFKSYIIDEKEILLKSNEIFDLLLKGFAIPLKEKLLISVDKFEKRGDEILLVLENKIKEKENDYLSQILLYYFEKISHIYLDNYFKSKIEKNEKNLLENEPLTVFKKCMEFLSNFNLSKSKIKNMSKLLYIGYIRVFLFKFEEYIRDKSEKLIDPKKVISTINNFKNPISYMVELYFYKVIYNKNNKEASVFSSENNLYNLKSLNNYKLLLSSKIFDDNSGDENDDKEDSFINLLEEKDSKQLENLKENYPFYEYFYYSDYIDEKYLSSLIVNDDCKAPYPVLAEYLKLKKNDNILNYFYVYNSVLNLINEEYSSKITREFSINETLDKLLIYQENKDLFTKFFDIYYKLSVNINSEGNDDDDENEDDNKINPNLSLTPASPLFKFLIVDENEFSKTYKDFYKQFIYKHNEIVEKLLDAKSKIFDVQNQKKDKINIQNITKEDDIFITKNDLIQNLLFNYSYRKIIINGKYSDFNKYEIDLEYIEEIMTDKLLKNKKLISDEIFEFKYKNEDLEFKNKDICTKLKEKIFEEELNINDKTIIYEYFQKNKGDVNLHLKLLDDFANLIHYTGENIDKIEEASKTKICDLIEKLEFISDDFKEIFKENNIFNINKLLNIYEYYQILCFNKVKDKLNEYQEEINEQEIKNAISKYIENDLKANKIIKTNLEIAIRKFILCFLTKENNKENKIKQNKNNIKNYLEIEDLWNKDFYKKNEFYQELKKLKDLGIKVNNVIHFYEKCFKNMHKNDFDDVKAELLRREEERQRKEKEKEKEDLSNFNPKDKDVDDNQKEPEENQNEKNKNNSNENNENEDENIDDNEDDYIDEVEEEEEYGGRY